MHFGSNSLHILASALQMRSPVRTIMVRSGQSENAHKGQPPPTRNLKLFPSGKLNIPYCASAARTHFSGRTHFIDCIYFAYVLLRALANGAADNSMRALRSGEPRRNVAFGRRRRELAHFIVTHCVPSVGLRNRVVKTKYGVFKNEYVILYRPTLRHFCAPIKRNSVLSAVRLPDGRRSVDGGRVAAAFE